MLKLKTPTIIIHLAVWLLFMSLPILFTSGGPDNTSFKAILISANYWIFNAAFILLFYLNTYFLIPEFYLRKKHAMYGVLVAFLFGFFYLLRPFDRLLQEGMRHNRIGELSRPMPNRFPEPQDRNFPGNFHTRPDHQKFDITSAFLFVMLVALGMAIQITRQWRNTEKRALKAEAEKATAELSFLKAQINPHFLFNTLNNIYSLAVTQSPNTAASIMKLSNIMRYITDEVAEEFVALDKEIAFIRDYIDLQTLRLGKNVQLEFSISGNPEHQAIAPLILMAFIENVFKYGISTHEPVTIIIKLIIAENTISFFCQNKNFSERAIKERNGIGLANTGQRLNHLYPNKHFLNITNENGVFTVQLTLQAS